MQRGNVQVKRLACALAALCLLLAPSMAEGYGGYGDYDGYYGSYGDYGGYYDSYGDYDSYGGYSSYGGYEDYIQYGDTDTVVGEIQDLLGLTETDRVSGGPLFGRYTQDAVESFQAENGLEVTGVITPETLLLLLGWEAGSEEASFLVWIPMHGGTRFHNDPGCSSMDTPRLVPEACAEELGFTPCKRCY